MTGNGVYILSKTSEYEEVLEGIGRTKKGRLENPYLKKFGKFEIEETAGSFIREVYLSIDKLIKNEEGKEEIKHKCSSKRAILALSEEKIRKIIDYSEYKVDEILKLMEKDKLITEASEEEVLEDKLEEDVIRPTDKMLRMIKGEKVKFPNITEYNQKLFAYPTQS